MPAPIRDAGSFFWESRIKKRADPYEFCALTEMKEHDTL